MSRLLDDTLVLLLQVLDLILLVLVLDALVRDLLLGHDDLLIDGLLELFPLLLELFQFFVDLANFSLEHAHVLTLEFVKLREDLFLLFDCFLAGLEVFSQLFFLFFEIVLLLLEALGLDFGFVDFALELVKDLNHGADFCLLLLDKVVNVFLELLLHLIECTLHALRAFLGFLLSHLWLILSIHIISLNRFALLCCLRQRGSGIALDVVGQGVDELA